MSVLIKGMEMPESCVSCKVAVAVKDGMLCTPMFRIVKEKILSGRQQDCPLVEVPPHGRLIDADALVECFATLLQFPSNLVNGQWIVNTLREQPTIMERETN